MSYIYIQMEIPEYCYKCPCYDGEYGVCRADKQNRIASSDTDDKPQWCPLIPVPDHGDLIDRDELTEITEKVYDHFKNGDEITTQEATIAYVFATGVINNAQTIIPADKEGEG